jgi:hypothetical protein
MSHPRSAVLRLLLHVSGCTGWRTRHVEPEVLVNQSQPDKIRVRRTDGSRMVLVDPAIQGDSVVGRHQRFESLAGPTTSGMASWTTVETLAGVRLVDVHEVQTRAAPRVRKEPAT